MTRYLAFILLLVAAPAGARELIYQENFLMRVGDNVAWADPHWNDSDWTAIEWMRIPKVEGIVWLRARIQLRPEHREFRGTRWAFSLPPWRRTKFIGMGN